GRNSVRTFGDRAYGPIWSALIPGTGNALAGTCVIAGRGCAPAPQGSHLSGPPSRQARRSEEVESAPGPSIWYGPGATPSRTPLAEQGYCRDCDTCDERGNAGKRQHVIEEIGLHGILPNRGTPRIPQEATGILVPGYRAAGDFFQ